MFVLSCCSPRHHRGGEVCHAGAFSPLHAHRDSRLLARLEHGTFFPEAQRRLWLSWALCPPPPQPCAREGQLSPGAGRCSWVVSRAKGDVTVRYQLQAVNHAMALLAHRLCTKFLGYFWV